MYSCGSVVGMLTFPRRFFSRLYWQTYSSSMQREHGAWPLHLVRIRWQWSHARLTLRLTGAEPRRSSLGVSVVVVASMTWARSDFQQQVGAFVFLTLEISTCRPPHRTLADVLGRRLV